MKRMKLTALLLALFMAFSCSSAFAAETGLSASRIETRDLKLAYLNDAVYGDYAYSAKRSNVSTSAQYDCFNSALSYGYAASVAQRSYTSNGSFVNWESDTNVYAIAGPGVTTRWFTATESSQAYWRVKIWVYSRGSEILDANASIK